MSDRPLSPDIVALMANKTGKKESTVRQDIYELRQKYSRLPINAVAQIYALKHGTSVRKKLTKDEKGSLPILEFEKPVIITKEQPTKK